MASTYSTNLKIELIGTGDQSGTWGTTTNGNLGTALEESIVGYGNPNFSSDANLTISLTDTYTTQTARCFALNVTSGVSLTATRNLVVPTIQKQYLIRNNTTGSQSIVVKTSGGSGVTVPNGAYTLVYVDGTNVVSQITQLPSLALATALPITSGGTGATSAATALAALGGATAGAVTASGLTMATARLLGRTTASTGAVEEISVGASLTLSGGSLSGTAASDTQAGVIEIAVQSEMETAASTTLAVTPGRMQYHPSAAKAWVNCDNTGTSTASYNVSSVTDVATGRAQANFTVSMSSANYAAIACTDGGGGGIFGGTAALATGSFELRSWNTATQTLQDSGRNYGAVFGDL